MMATAESVYTTIGSVCDVYVDLDQEQILDIILSRGEHTGNKFEDFVTITSGWEQSDWKSVLKEFYVSFQKAALCDMMFREIDPDMRPDSMIEAQKQVSSFKKAPDNYYLHMVNIEMETPHITPVSADVPLVLLSVYAAISSGENYGSVGYPPKEFIREVAGLEITQNEFYNTVISSMQEVGSFERKVCELAKEHKAEVKAMKAAYKKLIGKDIETRMGKVTEAASAGAAAASVKSEKALRKGKKFAGRVKDNAKVMPGIEAEVPSKKKRVEPVTAESAKAHGAHVKTFGKWGVIMLVLNGMATPAKFITGIVYIRLLFSSGFFRALGPSFLTLITCFIPALGCFCACSMIFAGIVPGKDPRKKVAYIIMCCGIICSAYSAVALIKLVLAMFTAWITHTFTLENIAHATSKGIFDVGKGLFRGIGDGISGLFN